MLASRMKGLMKAVFAYLLFSAENVGINDLGNSLVSIQTCPSQPQR
jgi:hypothetical protein